MNIYQELNKMINYIEDNIESKINYKDLSKFLGVNEYTMHRLFSLLCNITISEYIRNRRLSLAGYDLYKNKEKIIDIAMKYNYENATSFSRAFTKFHGIKPSIVKKTPKGLKNFAKIIFKEEINKITNFEYNIISKEEFTLYGIGTKTTNAKIKVDAPKHWSKVNNNFFDILGEVTYGMVVYKDHIEGIVSEYWALYEKYSPGLIEYKVPKSKWLVFKINSQEPDEIQEIADKFYLEFFPSCKYNLREIPELEYYHDNITEFLIPIDD